jgi:hypothetical protein
VNKASSLIGMNVRNLQNEKLGDIKDVVLDLPSGKIGYVVLSVGGFLGIGDKYIAVPPNALTISDDRASLLLNADKAKVENAPGFAKNDWPGLNHPDWIAQSEYWLSSKSQGTAGSALSGTGSSTDQNDKTFHGRITAVDQTAKALTVKGTLISHDFQLGTHPNVMLNGNRSGQMGDLKVGDDVVVTFHKDNGNYVADSIVESGTPEVKK